MTQAHQDAVVRAVVFDIGGILEVIPEGGDPTSRFPALTARWEARLGLAPGTLEQQIADMGQRLKRAGKDGTLGTFTEAELIEEIRHMAVWGQPQLDAFMHDHWNTYSGNPNPELAAYLRGLRPRYRTALLSNNFDGARREE